MIVVQARQLARSQTRLGPVTSSRLRRVSSRVLRGSTVQLLSSPLTLSVTLTWPLRTAGSASAARASSSAVEPGEVSPAGAAATPEPRRKSRRLGPDGPPPPWCLGSCSDIERISQDQGSPRRSTGTTNCPSVTVNYPHRLEDPQEP